MANPSLVATLFGAILFLVAVPTTTAHAHPAGASVSTGSNPVRSAAGVIDLGSTSTAADVIAAPAEYDLVLTDIVFGISTENDDPRCSGLIEVQGSDGTNYGVYTLRSGRVFSDNAAGASRQYAGTTGIRIPAGISVSLYFTSHFRSHSAGYYNLTYTLSGYLVQP